MAANLKHIVVHGVRDNPPPLGPTVVTRGFEKVAFPKIVRARSLEGKWAGAQPVPSRGSCVM